MNELPNHFNAIANQLEVTGIAVSDNLFSDKMLQALLSDFKETHQDGLFHKAHIGHGVTETRISEVRGDSIKWLEQKALTEAQTLYFQFLDALRNELSSYFRIALPWHECHLAAYPPGSFYARHLDQFRETNNRIFSAILYLNPNWVLGNGGELRYYLNNKPFDIEPLMGRFVCFRSDLIEHEVLKANVTRHSITGWLRRDEPTPVFLG